MNRRIVRFPLKYGEIVAAAPKAWSAEYDLGPVRAAPYALEGEHAIVQVNGPLAQHAYGYINYDALWLAVAAACECAEAKSVVLCIASPGGDFAGCIELSRELRAMCQAAGKKLIAFSDSQCASAAYAIACAADEIVVTPSAFVGSIGVWAALVDTVAADRAMGQNIKIVSSGARKVDHNPHVPITEGAVDAMQVHVDAMRDLFFGLVTDMRGVSRDTLTSLGGSELLGQQAVSAGLADRVVGSWAEFTRNPPSQAALATGNPHMSLKQAMAALAKAAEGDGEDAEKAKKCLAALEDDKKEDKKASAASEEKEKDEKEMRAKKAADESEKLEKDEKEAEKKAAASAGASFDLARELHALKAQLSAEKEATERAQLLATRPDFDKTVRASLEDAPLAFVRKACKDWPRVTNGSTPAAATVPGGTQGATGNRPQLNDDDAAHIADKMSGEYRGTGVRSRNNGFALELGYMSPEQVTEANAARAAAKGKA